MTTTIPTIAVRSEISGDRMVINASEYNPSVHVLWEDQKAENEKHSVKPKTKKNAEITNN